MYIGEITKQYRQDNNIDINDFAVATGLSVGEIETLENLFTPGTNTVVPVAMRQIKAIAVAMNLAIPQIIVQLSSNQPVVVNVVAESDQPHAK